MPAKGIKKLPTMLNCTVDRSLCLSVVHELNIKKKKLTEAKLFNKHYHGCRSNCCTVRITIAVAEYYVAYSAMNVIV